MIQRQQITYCFKQKLTQLRAGVTVAGIVWYCTTGIFYELPKSFSISLICDQYNIDTYVSRKLEAHKSSKSQRVESGQWHRRGGIIVSTSQMHCSTFAHDARPLTTHVVMPQCGCSHGRWYVCQADDEIVRSVACRCITSKQWQSH